MSVTDFIYDNTLLSSFDNGQYVISNFSVGNTPTEGQRNVAQTSLFMGKEQPFLYQTYTSTLTFVISIIKNPCIDSDTALTVQEVEKMKRWLCRPAPHVFRLIKKEYEDVFWEGSFNITEELIGSRRVGVTLTFISTRPFAVQNDTLFSGTVTSGEEITINDSSAELGYLYPDMTVTCLADGDLIIHNDFEDRSTIVKNCSENEVITFSKYLQIKTSLESHELFDDFNYKFLRICNNYATTENVITFSLPCEYEIVYNPIRKVIPV